MSKKRNKFIRWVSQLKICTLMTKEDIREAENFYENK